MGNFAFSTDLIIYALVALVIVYFLFGIKIVPQTEAYLVARLGKYNRTLNAGPNFIFPIIEHVRFKETVLERVLEFPRSAVFTNDNAEAYVEAVTYYKITDPARARFRILDLDEAITNMIYGNVRSVVGTLAIDELLSNREEINTKLLNALRDASDDWGIQVTRSEITNVDFSEQTKKAMQQQANAERERRATVTKAQGERESVQLAADAQLYEAKKIAEAKRIAAEAQAYAVTTVAEAIKNNGQEAVQFEVMLKQIGAIESLGNSDNSKLLVLPTNVTETLGGLASVVDIVKGGK